MKSLIFIILALFSTTQNSSELELQKIHIRSGKITYKFYGRETGSKIIYFDDFGNYYYEYNCTKVMDKPEIVSIKIIIHDTLILLNPQNRIATKTIINSKSDKIKSILIYPKLLERMKYKRSGTEVISGVLCEKYLSEGGEFCIWNNLILKSEVNVMNTNSKMESTELLTGIKIPKQKFKIPNNYKLTNK